MKVTRAKTVADYRYIASLYNRANSRYLVSKTMTVRRLKAIPAHDFLCTVRGERVGWFRLLPHVRHPRQAHVILIIDRPYWSKGYGTQAMAALEKIARKLGYRRLLLRVMAGNDRALRVYRKFGFKPRYTLIHMAKSLTKRKLPAR